MMLYGERDGERNGERDGERDGDGDDPVAAVGYAAGSPHAVPVTERDLSWEELVERARELGRDARFSDRSDVEVEDAVAVGAAQLDAAMCSWLEALGEFVVRGGWAEQGARTPGVWLSWRLGIAPSTAREHVRVALRLREFPLTRERFAAGTLSYSKVRCVTRFGEPAFESLMLRWADGATAAQLETVARGFRAAERARLGIGADGDDRTWGFSGRSYADGSRTLTVRGPAEVIAALEGEIERLAQVVVDDRTPNGSSAAVGARPDADADATPDSDRDADADTAPDADADAAPDDDREFTRSSDDDATVRGTDPLGAADDLSGGDAARTHVTAEDRVDALVEAIAAAAAARAPVDTSGLDRHTLVLTTTAQELLHPPVPESQAGTLPGGSVVVARDDHRKVAAMDRRVLRRLACEAAIVLVVTDEAGATLDVGRRRRRTTAALRRAVQQRDRGCTFPGCGATRNIHAHHVRHWADGGETNLGNLVSVCGFHHRFVHQGTWRIEVRADGQHQFRAGPSDEPLERLGRHVEVVSTAVADAAPVSASAEALRPSLYAGGGFDRDAAIIALQFEHELLRADLGRAA